MLTSETDPIPSGQAVLAIDPDPARWLVLPPLGAPTDAWIDASLERLRHHEGFEAEAYRGMLEHALALRSEDDTWTLQWWPGPPIINTVVHVVALDSEDRWAMPAIAAGIPFVDAPAIDVVDHVDLGRGIELRGRIASDLEGISHLGVLAHAYADGRSWIGVVTEPTLPAIATALLHDLRVLVRSLHVEGAWAGARLEALPEAELVRRAAEQGEWRFEDDA